MAVSAPPSLFFSTAGATLPPPAPPPSPLSSSFRPAMLPLRLSPGGSVLLFLPPAAMGTDPAAAAAQASGLCRRLAARKDGEVATTTALGARAGPVWKRRPDVALILISSAKHGVGIRQFELAAVLEYLAVVLQ